MGTKVIDYAELGQRVAQRRKFLRYTQEQVAEQADLTATYLGMIERAESKPSIETIFKLCKVLEITPDYLLIGLDNLSKVDDFEEVKVDYYRCNTAQRKHIKNYIRWMVDQDSIK